MKITVENITPAVAAKMLESNTYNRKLRVANVAKWAHEMACGRWRETGDPIRFFSDGRLADGQNRLHAVVKSGVTIKCLVIRGLEPEAMEGIDMGAKRSVADYMHLHYGMTEANLTCAAINCIFMICNGFTNTSQSIELVKLGADKFENELNVVRRHCQGFKLARRSWVVGSIAFAMQVEPKLDQFAYILCTGEDAKRGNPALTARNWLIDGSHHHMSKSGSKPKASGYECFFNAMFAFAQGKQLSRLCAGAAGLSYFRSKQRKFIAIAQSELSKAAQL